MEYIKIDGFEPDMLLSYLRATSKFNVDILEGWLHDLQEYRAIGTPQQCAKMKMELSAANTLLTVMAEYIFSGVPLNCECCTNGMRNMDWGSQYKGCDGNCKHSNGIPNTPEEVLAYFRTYIR